MVRNVLESEVKYDLLGIHLKGMARICLASMNDEQNMKMMGTIVKIIRSTRTMYVMTSAKLTFPTNWLFMPHLHQYSTSSPPFWALNCKTVRRSMMMNRMIDMALALPRYPPVRIPVK